MKTFDYKNFITDERVKNLFSSDKDEVVRAVESLSREEEGSVAEGELVEVLEEFEQDDEGYSFLWSAVILGNIGSKTAIPALLDAFDLDYDYMNEAIETALQKIARKHPDEAFDEVSDYVFGRFEIFQDHGRLFAYGGLEELALSEKAETRDGVRDFFLRALELDDTWQGPILSHLKDFKDARLLDVVKRQIAIAEMRGDEMDRREAYEAYLSLSGEPSHEEFHAKFLSQKREPVSFEEEYRSLLEELEDDDDDDEEEDDEENDSFSDVEALLAEPPQKDARDINGDFEEFEREMQKMIEMRDSYPIASFSLETYLDIRPRGDTEEDFASALRLTGLSESWSVEDVQKEMNKNTRPAIALSLVLGGRELPSHEAMEEFATLFFKLWNATPREEFNGLTPEEIADAESDGMIPHIARDKIGRNNPCFCGSGRKYKHCHGK